MNGPPPLTHSNNCTTVLLLVDFVIIVNKEFFKMWKMCLIIQEIFGSI